MPPRMVQPGLPPNKENAVEAASTKSAAPPPAVGGRTEKIPIPPDLCDSFTDDSLSTLKDSSGISQLMLDKKNHCLVAYGSKSQLKRIQVVVKYRVKHLTEKAKLEELTKKEKAKLEEMEKKISDSYKEIFDIDTDLLGLIIGREGKNIQKVKDQPGVKNIDINRDKGVISILADNRRAALRAREMLEFVEEQYPILKSKIGVIVGREFKKVNEIKMETGLVRLRLIEQAKLGETEDDWDDAGEKVNLLLLGTREAVEETKVYLNHHVDLLKRTNQEQKRVRDLARKLSRLKYDFGRTHYNTDGGNGSGRGYGQEHGRGNNSSWRDGGGRGGAAQRQKTRGRGRGRGGIKHDNKNMGTISDRLNSGASFGNEDHQERSHSRMSMDESSKEWNPIQSNEEHESNKQFSIDQKGGVKKGKGRKPKKKSTPGGTTAYTTGARQFGVNSFDQNSTG